MKITKMLFFAALGLWSPLCWGQSGSRVSGNLRSEELQLEYQNLSNPSDSLTKIIACASDRSFSFDLPDPEAAYMVKLSVPGTSAKLSFPAMPGESAEVKGWDTGFMDRPTQIGGSGFYARWKELGKKIDSLHLIGMKGYFSYTAAAKDRKSRESGLLQKYAQQSESAMDELRGTAWNYMKEHPGDPVSIMMLQYLKEEDIEKGFNLLDQTVREGVLAPYALDLVARSKEKLERRGVQRKRIEEQEKAEAPDREAAEKLYASASKKKLEAGDAFPALVFTDMEGKEFSLSSLKGKYVYIDVWATWCAPCAMEQPSLKKLEESLAKKNIAFVSISTDTDRVAWEEVVKKEGLGGVQLYAGGARNAFNKFFLIYGIPRFILLDREGKVLNANMSRPSYQGTEAALQGLEGL